MREIVNFHEYDSTKYPYPLVGGNLHDCRSASTKGHHLGLCSFRVGLWRLQAEFKIPRGLSEYIYQDCRLYKLYTILSFLNDMTADLGFRNPDIFFFFLEDFRIRYVVVVFFNDFIGCHLYFAPFLHSDFIS